MWNKRLQADHPTLSDVDRVSIVNWLIGSDRDRYDTMSPEKRDISLRAMDYRYRLLGQHYLGVNSARAYKQLIQRLSGLFLLRNKVRTWIALSRDRQRTVRDVLQEVIQEMLLSDSHLRRQIAWIRQCTSSTQLRDTLTLASADEYCRRPINNQPLLVYRFLNYLNRSQRGGMTQVPSGDLIRLVSEEIGLGDESEGTISLLDNQAIADYQEQEFWENQQAIRQQVKDQFLAYLAENVDPVTAAWLELHLQGLTQEAISQEMNLPINEVYRIREKVSYHAIRVFTLKQQPELVMGWLQTSLQEHKLGLSPDLWEAFVQELSAEQREVLTRFQNGDSVETIARALGWRSNQVTGEWTKIYLLSQKLRADAA